MGVDKHPFLYYNTYIRQINNKGVIDVKLTEEQKLMVEENMNLIYYVINMNWKGQPQQVKEELFQEGCIALINACKQYNDNYGAFSTYAVKCIQGRLINSYTRLINNQFKVTSNNYKEASEQIVLRVDKKISTEYNDLSIIETIADKNDDLETFINRYSWKQEARWVTRFASDEDYEFLLNYTTDKANSRGDRKKIAQNYKRYHQLIRKSRIFNKHYELNMN